MPLRVGDRVRCIHNYDNNDLIVGEVGTVRGFFSDGGRLATTCEIEFDRNIGGHNLSVSTRCANGHGWRIPEEYLELTTTADSHTVRTIGEFLHMCARREVTE